MAKNTKRDESPEFGLERALDTSQVSELTGLAPITLAQHRARGSGPPFFRIGSRTIRYRLGDVLDWRDSRTVGAR
jgi:predicted DNA-binding transcriptional regulator AlpA